MDQNSGRCHALVSRVNGYNRTRRAALLISICIATAFVVATQAFGQQGGGEVDCTDGQVATLGYADYTTCRFDTVTDLDTFRFEGAADTDVRISAVGISGFVGPTLDIRDPSGDPLHSGFCTPPDCRFTLTEPGIYTVLATESGTNNTGNYEVTLNCLFGACPGAPATPELGYDATEPEVFEIRTDMDFFTFEGLVGTEVRIAGVGLSGFVSPSFEIRDPNGNVLHDGSCAGVGCTTEDFNLQSSATLPESGTYILLITEGGSNNTGSYEVTLNCLFGDCPGAPAAPTLPYDETVLQSFERITDVDFLAFEGSEDCEIRIAAVGLSGFVSPILEIRDPDGVLLHNGACPAAGCETLDFTEQPSAALTKTGTYLVEPRESGTDNTGSYETTLNFLYGPCDPDLDGVEGYLDNCVNVPNPEQTDSNGDWFGNVCDPDYNNDGVVGTSDFNDFRSSFGCREGEDCYDPDYNLTEGDEVIGTPDFNVFRSFFSKAPGPAVLPLFYDATHATSFASVTDVDSFTFDGLAGTEIRIAAVGLSGFVSPTVEIRDPYGNLLHDGPCAGVGCDVEDFNLVEVVTLPETGTYLVAIRENGTDNTGSYEITLNCMFGPCPDAPAAVDLPYDDTLGESFERRTDVDFFHFEGAAGSEIRIISIGLSGFVSPILEIRDPSGNLLHDGSCGGVGCTTADFNIQPSPSVPTTGGYLVAVREGGTNNTGSYEITLNCLFGCP
jgi:hypothetical protein